LQVFVPDTIDQGHDTTASAVGWSYYYLSKHPAELATLRKELDNIFGPNTSPAQVAQILIEDPIVNNKLEFTLSVVKEAIRLEPPAGPVREPRTDGYYLKTRSGAMYPAEKGTMLYTSAYLLHRNKDVWGEDASEFRPARFMPGSTIPWGYISFSKRPRDCIGMPLAYLAVFPRKRLIVGKNNFGFDGEGIRI
jgi:cytochrome P450